MIERDFTIDETAELIGEAPAHLMTEGEWQLLDDEKCAREAEEWDAIVAEREEAEARRIEAEENERTEREDCV